ncbi:MAG: YitT family protein [Lutibacter sp.]
MKYKIKLEIKNYSFIVLGSLISAIGVVGFLVPNKIATGGTAGLAIILHYLLKFPTGLLIFLVNTPLLIISIRFLGKHFAIKSIIAILSISAFVDLLAEIVHFPELSNTTLLATLYGGMFVGIGLGFIFKGNASAGGSTIVAKILNEKLGIKPGNTVLSIDIFVVLLAGIVFKNIELALWSMISIFVTSKFIDLIITGIKQNKIVHISANNLEELKHLITEKMGVTGTLIKGNDLHYQEGRNIIFLSINKNRIQALKNLVEEYDSNAYMVVLEATEVLGSSRKLPN